MFECDHDWEEFDSANFETLMEKWGCTLSKPTVPYSSYLFIDIKYKGVEFFECVPEAIKPKTGSWIKQKVCLNCGACDDGFAKFKKDLDNWLEKLYQSAIRKQERQSLAKKTLEGWMS